MDNEREVEQMVKTLYRAGVMSETYNKVVAKVLVEAGYRKAEDVQKETVMEVLDKLLTISPIGYEQLKAFVKVREEEYGVEVL